MGRVGQEAPAALLRLPGTCLRTFQRIQHLVQGLGGLAELGVGPPRSESAATLPAGDAPRQPSHIVQRTQGDPNDQHHQCGARCKGDQGSQDQHSAQSLLRRAYLADIDADRERGPVDPTGVQPGAHRAGVNGPWRPRREDRSVLLLQPRRHSVRTDPIDDLLRPDSSPGQLPRQLDPTRQQGVEVALGLGDEDRVDDHTQHGQHDGQSGDHSNRHPGTH